MMRKISVQAVLAVTAFSVGAVFAPVCAQDAEEAPAAAAAEDGLPSPQPEAKPFTALFRCVRATGTVQILKPNASEWEAVKEGHFYPLGTSMRILKDAGTSGSAEFSFGPEASLKMEDAAEKGQYEVKVRFSARSYPARHQQRFIELYEAQGYEAFFRPNYVHIEPSMWDLILRWIPAEKQQAKLMD